MPVTASTGPYSCGRTPSRHRPQILTGSLAAGSAVTVASGATLTGTGTISGSLSLSGGAIHAPGAPTGVQSVGGALSYGAGALSPAMPAIRAQCAGGSQFLSTRSTRPKCAICMSPARTTASTAVVSSNGMTGVFTVGTITNDSGGKAASTYGSFSLTQNASGATLNWTPKPFTAWRGTSFGANATNATISGFLADPDGDGLLNGWEYFYGTNPSANTPSPLQTQTTGGRFSVTFPRNTAATDVTAIVRGADTPGGPWTDLAQSTGGAAFTALVNGVTVAETGTDAMRTVQVQDLYLTSDPAHPKRFFRLFIQEQ